MILFARKTCRSNVDASNWSQSDSKAKQNTFCMLGCSKYTEDVLGSRRKPGHSKFIKSSNTPYSIAQKGIGD